MAAHTSACVRESVPFKKLGVLATCCSLPCSVAAFQSAGVVFKPNWLRGSLFVLYGYTRCPIGLD